LKLISIGDGKGKNAMVGIAPYYKKIKKEERDNVISHRIIKSTLKTHFSTIEKNTQNDNDELFTNLVYSDPEVDLQEEGRFVKNLHYTFVNEKNELVSDVRFEEEIFYADGSQRERRNFNPSEANIQNENLPIRWTGVTIPVYQAMRRYIFSHTYQLFHTNGLTYSFLFDLASRLHEKKEMMFIGGGVGGSEPIVLMKGGKKYRGFMSGHIAYNNSSYKLLIHLTDIDLEDY
jgi:hypothetical protein